MLTYADYEHDPNPYRIGPLPQALMALPASSGTEAFVLPPHGGHTVIDQIGTATLPRAGYGG
jgi:hypothetical protein